MLKLVSCALSEAAVWRLGGRRLSSAPGAVAARADKTEPAGSASDSPAARTDGPSSGKSSGLVAATFASLNLPEDVPIPKPSPKSVKVNKLQQIDNHIAAATDLNTLLSVAENPVISQRHALKVVSVLSDWSNSNKVRLQDFEKDSRFLRLCRVLGRSRDSAAVATLTRADDLSTVLSITGDEEAARLVADLTLVQMIKVMTALAARGRRSTPLLRSLAHNITKQQHTLNMKQSADLLYAMASLNFPDPTLMDKICQDITESLPTSAGSPAIVSSLVSLGLLRYRSPLVLDALSSWVAAHEASARDVQAALMTLATLSYQAEALDKIVEMALRLKPEDLARPTDWLEVVWSLLLLQKASPELVASVLCGVERLYARELPIATRRKLQLLDSYLSLTAPAAAPRLSEHVTAGPPPTYSREKQHFVQSVLDTLRSLLSSDNFVKTGCNSGMGFLYDAEFAVDANCHPVPLETAAADNKVSRVAVLALGYHDLTRKTVEPLGVSALYRRLLELKGYKVLLVPYTEFSPRDKLVSRVQCLERRLRDLVTSPTT